MANCGHDVRILWGVQAQRDRAEADRDRLASLLDRARPHLRHSPLCANVGGYEYDCNCGLADLIAEAWPDD